jgi:hypothetical protein
MSVVAQLATEDALAKVCPRQHRMAGVLVASFVDLFKCVAVTGNRFTLESVRDGKTFDVYEHMDDPVEYSTGWLCAGRLLPFGDAGYLRSPGMIFVHPADPGLVFQAAAALDAFGETLPPALALEATISSVVLKVTVPRVRKPAQSKAHARRMFDVVSTLLADPDFALETTDPTLDAFMAALAHQAEGGGGPSGQKKARRGKKAKRRR